MLYHGIPVFVNARQHKLITMHEKSLVLGLPPFLFAYLGALCLLVSLLHHRLVIRKELGVYARPTTLLTPSTLRAQPTRVTLLSRAMKFSNSTSPPVFILYSEDCRVGQINTGKNFKIMNFCQIISVWRKT